MSSATAVTDNTKRGSLTIAGSGIASVAHFTLETVSHLKNADKVVYLVIDPVTEAFIQENNQNTIDLYPYYGKEKHRYETYVEMTEVMLREVRAGHRVLGLFYGHPGFYMIPPHRALTLARGEGYEAKMLPGISSFDYMLADLEFEPARYGCTILEATDLLVHDRRLEPSMHTVILQVSIVGVSTLEHDNSQFQLLVDRLERDFGPDHKVVLYSGAVLPQSSSAMVVFNVEDLRKDGVIRGITSRSSLYIPPREIPTKSSAMADALQLQGPEHSYLDTPPVWVGSRFVHPALYGPAEQAILSKLEQGTAPESYKSLHGSAAMKRFMIDLARDPLKRQEYIENPSLTIQGVSGLTDCERTGLEYKSDGPVYAIMMREAEEEPDMEQLAEADRGDNYTVHDRPGYSVEITLPLLDTIRR